VRPTAGAVASIRFKGPLTSQALGAQLAEAGIGIKPNPTPLPEPEPYP